MYSNNNFVEVYEINRIEKVLKCRNVDSGKESSINYESLSVYSFVIHYRGRDYPLNKSQWSLNKKNLHKECLFYFVGAVNPVRIWNLTLDQQAELMRKFKEK